MHRIVKIAKRVGGILLHPSWYILLFILTHYWLVDFVGKNIIIDRTPPTTWMFRKEAYNREKCLRDLEVLVIAAKAYPQTYKNFTFGIPEAFSRLREDACNTPRFWLPKPLLLEPKYVKRLKTWSEQQYSQLDELSWKSRPVLKRYDKRVIGGVEFSSYYSPSTIGHLWRLISQYPILYSGQGIMHYVRCDYSLNTEPYHTFLLSNLHENPDILIDKFRKRIDECNARATLTEEIQEILRTSPLLPIQIQARN